jgi:integration host factor subunit beta
MNKIDLINKLSESHDMTKQQATKVVDMFFNEMTAALEKRDRVEIRGLCAMSVKEYKSYTGRNPKSGEQVVVASKKLPFFKCGTELKKRVNNS